MEESYTLKGQSLENGFFCTVQALGNTELPWWLRRKKICLQCRRPGFKPWVGKIPWRREWQSIPVFLPGESHGQRSLAGYSPWGHKELDTTERLTHTPETFFYKMCRTSMTTHMQQSTRLKSKEQTQHGAGFVLPHY